MIEQLEYAARCVLLLAVIWPLFRLILEGIALLSHVFSLAFCGKPGPLSDISIVLILLRRYRNHRACLAARARYTPPPPPQTTLAVVTEKRSKAKHYHGAKRPLLQYHAAFRLADGREVWLSLSEAEYNRLFQGDRGVLAFREKEKLYLSFQANTMEAKNRD